MDNMTNQDFTTYSGSPDLDDVTPFMQEVLMDTDCNIENINDEPSKEKWNLNLKLHKVMQFDPILVDKYFYQDSNVFILTQMDKSTVEIS